MSSSWTGNPPASRSITSVVVGITSYTPRSTPVTGVRVWARVLVKGALDDIRARGETIVPLCPFVAAWLARHPDYQDLIDQAALDRINRAD